MKKLVTLSAVALAGATIGVGSTFGWWAAEDVESLSPQVAQKKPADSKIESVTPVEAAFESEGAQIDIIGDSQVQPPKVVIIREEPFQTELQAEKVDRLAKAAQAKNLTRALEGALHRLREEANRTKDVTVKQALETDVISLQEELRKARAAIEIWGGRPEDRGVLSEVPKTDTGAVSGQSVLKKTDARFDLPQRPLQKPLARETKEMRHFPPSSSPSGGVPKHLEREMHELHEALSQTEDPAAKEKLQTAIRDLKTKLQHSQANGPRFKVQHFEFPGQPGMPPGPRMMAFGAGPGGVPPFAIEELRKVAENLQREGHKDQAQAVREHADRLQRQAQEMQARMKEGAQHARREFERGPGDGPREIDGRDGDRPRPEMRKEGPGRPDGRGPGFHDGDRHEHHPGEFHGPEGHHPPMPMGHHHGEVLGMLQALHHEIAQLRGEVHQLRKMLGDDHHYPHPGDMKHRKEGGFDKQKAPQHMEKGQFKSKPNPAEGKGKVKVREDDGKGKAKQGDGEGKGKAKQDDDDDDDNKGQAKNRDDDDDDDRQDKKKNLDDDDDDREEGKNRKDDDRKDKDDDDDEQLDDAPAKENDDDDGAEDKAAEVKAEQKAPLED